MPTDNYNNNFSAPIEERSCGCNNNNFFINKKMGSISSKEKIESKMLMLKLKKIQIRRERNERIKQLQILTGKEIIRETIPDYIEREDTEKEIDLIK